MALQRGVRARVAAVWGPVVVRDVIRGHPWLTIVVLLYRPLPRPAARRV